MIKLQINRSINEEFIASAETTIRRIFTISLIYEELYSNFDQGKARIDSYLTAVVMMVLHSSGIDVDSIDLDLRIDTLLVSVQSAAPIGLILSEVLANSVMFAFPYTDEPVLEISFQVISENYVLRIKDNGPGYESLTSESGLGLTIVQALSQQLKGNFDYKNENGTLFILTFPKK